ncbi:MAG: hypothetical protein CL779_00285 [Chloroflexi bacterium]|nr:hypothetical protein [Chloroflexota bacterium]|tara:strand:- start:4569 stop:5414 length:846 start_codon:yes stop_codon:yes gene_type:complete
MTIFEFINFLILITIQSVTEFLPVSSSGHLIIYSSLFPESFDISFENLSLHVLLHVGSATAILVYFFNDWKKIIVDFFSNIKDKKLIFNEWDSEGQLSIKIICATIPAVLVGFFFYEIIANNLRNNYVVAIALLIGAIILFFAEKYNNSNKNESLQKISYKNYFLLGIMQSCAFIPGLSRSGIVISSALFLKIDKKDSVKLAFLMSCPVILGATVHELIFNFNELIFDNITLAIIGYIYAFISSLLVIKFLFHFINKYSFSYFVGYRIVLSMLLLFVEFFG